MPVLTSPPLIGGAGKPVTGRVAIQATAEYEWTDGVGVVHHVTTTPQSAVVRDGQFFDLDGTTPLTLIPTPVDVGMRVVLHLDESGAQRGQHVISRVVDVPDVSTIAWGDLVDVVPPVVGGDYVIPTWAATVITYRDEAAASSTSAQTAASSALASANAADADRVAAETARAGAEAVGNTNDTIIASRASDPASAARPAIAAAAVAATVRARPLNGTRTIIIGDSISILGTTGIQGQSHTTWAFWESDGKLTEVARIAVSGNTSAQQLTALQSYWAGNPSPKPTMALVLVGTNDIGQGWPLATWLDNVKAIVALNTANGCDTVLCTLPPRSGPTNPTAPATLNGVWNKALRDYAYANGITVVDYWGAVADPATGEWRAGEVNPADGVHPNYKGTRRMANEVKRTLYPLLTEPTERGQAAGMTTRVTADGGLLPTPIFTAAGDPATMGFTTVTPAATWTSVWEPAAPGGYAIELNTVNPTVQPDLMQRAWKTDGGWVNGDRLLAVARFRVISSTDVVPGSGVRVSLTQSGGGASYGVFCFGQFMPTAEWQTVRFAFTPDPAATALNWYFQYVLPAGVATDAIRARIASMQIYNLTSMGLA